MIGKNFLLFLVVILMALTSSMADCRRGLRWGKKTNLCGIDCQSDCECDSKCSACIPDPDDTEGDAPRLKCRQPQNEGPV